MRTFALMRVLAFLFSLYFFVLSCQACTDASAPSVQSAAYSATMLPAHCADEPAGDWCSPLCQCHCCPGFALPVVLASLMAEKPATAGSQAYAAAPVLSVPARVPAPQWQPPQVG